jgi:hypothetical protein
VIQGFNFFGLHPDYHQPQDEISRIDFPHLTPAIASMASDQYSHNAALLIAMLNLRSVRACTRRVQAKKKTALIWLNAAET